MSELEKALADIVAIRGQIARGTTFRGYGPATLAATGCLALAVAAAQSHWPTGRPLVFFGVWVGAAVVAGLGVGAEMLTRSRRLHSGLADAMIAHAVDQFLPAGAAGAGLALVLFRFAPDSVWMLPGLWQVLVSLGLFASSRSLPRAVVLAAAWYFLASLTILILASMRHDLSPWFMGIPFAGGQWLLALIVHSTGRGHDGED